jgi:hypothetical protein
MNKKYIGIGVSLGLCFGAALGAAMQNIGLGMALGVALGTAFGAGWPSKERRLRHEDTSRLTVRLPNFPGCTILI